MAQITSKELSGLSDLLTMEQTIIAKYKQFATESQDSALGAKYEQLACRHQRHYDQLVSNLK
ncbi:MAG: spore coat protein [Ruminococcaceae bacterium]|nr:spore coat protein [Oscillospiraceae bacterium]